MLPKASVQARESTPDPEYSSYARWALGLSTAATTILGYWFSNGAMYSTSVYGLVAGCAHVVNSAMLWLSFGYIPRPDWNGNVDVSGAFLPIQFIDFVAAFLFSWFFLLLIYGAVLYALLSSLVAISDRLARRPVLVLAAICCALLSGGIFIGTSVALERSKDPKLTFPAAERYYFVFASLFALSSIGYTFTVRSAKMPS